MHHFDVQSSSFNLLSSQKLSEKGQNGKNTLCKILRSYEAPGHTTLKI